MVSPCMAVEGRAVTISPAISPETRTKPNRLNRDNADFGGVPGIRPPFHVIADLINRQTNQRRRWPKLRSRTGADISRPASGSPHYLGDRRTTTNAKDIQ